jgi:hypothetical protein
MGEEAMHELFRLLFTDAKRVMYLMNITASNFKPPLSYRDIIQDFLTAFIVKATPDFRINNKRVYFFKDNPRVFMSFQNFEPREAELLFRIINAEQGIHFESINQGTPRGGCVYTNFRFNGVLSEYVSQQAFIELFVESILHVAGNDIRRVAATQFYSAIMQAHVDETLSDNARVATSRALHILLPYLTQETKR